MDTELVSTYKFTSIYMGGGEGGALWSELWSSQNWSLWEFSFSGRGLSGVSFGQVKSEVSKNFHFKGGGGGVSGVKILRRVLWRI